MINVMMILLLKFDSIDICLLNFILMICFYRDLQLNNISIIRKDDFKGFRQLRLL